MILSQRIARLLEEMLEESGGELSIARNALAEQMGCVPSQINYVITSRFTPERGYVVESRRGGGGFIRIRKVAMGKDEYLMHFYHAVGNRIDEESARVFLAQLVGEEVLTPREASLVLAAFSNGALSLMPRADRDVIRAQIFRSVLLEILSQRKGE